MTKSISVHENHALQDGTEAVDSFIELVDLTLKTVSLSTSRIYDQTYRKWLNYCEKSSVSPFDLTFANVAEFLQHDNVSKATLQRQLSALRKLCEMLSILDYANPRHESALKSLKKLKVNHLGAKDVNRDRSALSPAQVDKILRVWIADSLLELRNQAMISVLFFTGMRRSELVALQWQDIDLDEGTILIRFGKGDKERTVSIAGDFAVEALLKWRDALGDAREFVFPSIGKGNKLGKDKPTQDQTVYRVVKCTEAKSGIAFSPHTSRRTFITEGLSNSVPLADMQAQAGHRQEATTLRYARPVDARQRRQRLRLRYG